MYLIPKCRTEFGKRNSINVGIKMAMELNIDVCLLKFLTMYSSRILIITKLTMIDFKYTRYNLRTLVSTTSLAYGDNNLYILDIIT
ncbi:putative RNA-directed DNA polymerase [Aphis craccivora]|uniref:Putative RNA-directed DNA polymerase n=1 Tax=Aphis craccivora TaxID=307492 RepID=A0A6G0YE71_APHCR|nr:putative RNA-directed DNA polymerase [Aphis craccivora]KAF0754277.1 putative RNA-directed DNA polymerase [Aphis craccivora]